MKLTITESCGEEEPVDKARDPSFLKAALKQWASEPSLAPGPVSTHELQITSIVSSACDQIRKVKNNSHDIEIDKEATSQEYSVDNRDVKEGSEEGACITKNSKTENMHRNYARQKLLVFAEE